MHPNPLRFLRRWHPVLLAASVALLASISSRAAEPVPPLVAPKITVAIMSPDVKVRQDLVELDRLLEINPNFEAVLRENIDHLEEASFREGHPEVARMLTEKPGVVPALKLERHFLIKRYVLRRAHGPLLRDDVVALDAFLTAHADIRRELDREPSLIMDDNFLTAHGSLAGFFDQHPALSTVLLEGNGPRPAPKSQ